MTAHAAWRLGFGALAAAAVASVAALPWLAPLQRVMLPLVILLGGLTLRFSYRYLDGAPHTPRFVGWFSATVAAAATVVLADNLILMALAWTATSLSLHQLLTWSEGRPAAEVAAHKKFLLSRLADLHLYAAIALLVAGFGTTSRAVLLERAATMPVLPTSIQLAGVLLAVAVILRSAQLPVHGWLLQVMEAPTPVSALLHAGIVNLGAYVLISLAPLLPHLPIAQGLLVVVGSLTATLALLAQRTKGNIKGALAWSTVAQMGFVIAECGLGLFDLALVHVVSHAFYKAHAFLSSGSAVESAVRLRGAQSWPAPSVLASVAGTLAAAAAVTAATWLSASAAGFDAGRLVGALILGLAVAPAMTAAVMGNRPALGIAVGIPAAYVGWHWIAGSIVPAVARSAAPIGAAVVAGVSFTMLAALQWHVAVAPQGRVARALYPHAQAGFHLDEIFTRLTFRIWPPRLTPRRVFARRASVLRAVERAA